MKFLVSQSDFYKALNLAGKSLLVRPNLPVLANVLIKAGKDKLEVISTNLETATRVGLNCRVELEGQTTVNGKTLLEFVGQLPEGELTVEKLGEEIVVGSSGFKARMAIIAPEEFPAIPQVTKGTKIELSGKEFVKSVSRVAFAAAMDEGRPILTGVLCDFGKGSVKFVATDGYRLSFDQMDANAETGMKVVVPARALLEAAKIIVEVDQSEGAKFTWKISENLNQVNFSIGSVEFTSRLIEGEYPGWQKVIPAVFPTKASVTKEDFVKLVKVASIFAKDAGSIVKVRVEPDSKRPGRGVIKVGAQASEVGSSDGLYEIDLNGPGGEIAFNYKYLIEALSVIGEETVTFEMVENLNPGKISGGGSKDRFFHIIMPVRLQS